MANLESIRQKLAQQITKSGYTFRQISLKIGRKDSYVQQYIRYGFPKRLNEIDRRKICHLLQMDEKELIDDELISNILTEPAYLNIKENLDNPADFIMIDIYAHRPNTSFNDSVIGRMTLNFREFSTWCTANPYNLRIIRIEGDYMEPALPIGSLILYDSSIQQYKGDGIYIVSTNDVVQIKRIQQVEKDQYLILSDNPQYKDITSNHEDLHFLGRAINCLSTQML